MHDTDAADRLFNQGYEYIEKENINGSKNVVRQLLHPPDKISAEIERGHQSGVLK